MHFLLQIIIVELVLYKKNINDIQLQARSTSQYRFFKWMVHPYILALYLSLGAFLTGAAICQSSTDLMKYSIGRLRQHFIAVCKPKWSSFNCTDEKGYMRYVEEDVCTGDLSLIEEARYIF